MSEVIQMSDPCEGHDCDGCRTCLRGRCCRRDNRAYTLPTLGDWDGPVFGKIGVLYDDGQRAECHCCGRFFGNLGNHALRTHDLTPDEYKAIFGLNATRSLAGPATHDLHRRNMLAQPARFARLAEVGRRVLAEMTPEQRTEWSSGPRRPEHREKFPKMPPPWRRADPRSGEEKRADPVWRQRWRMKIAVVRGAGRVITCVICGCTFCRLPHNRSVVSCSPACDRERRRRTSTAANVMARPDVRRKISAARTMDVTRRLKPGIYREFMEIDAG